MTSALAALPDGSVTSPAGFTAAAAHAGLKADGALDVALLVSTASCATAGVFTRNAVRAAPVVYDADLLSERPGRMRAVAMNARVANACTGAEGLEAARAMARAAEEAAGLPPRTALVLSTGVIGVPLPVDKVAAGLRQAATRLGAAGGVEAARAIMTTDTRVKHCAVRLETPAGAVTVGGIAKGAGMIHPDMATLLGVLTTDAASEPSVLGPFLKRVADRTFNAISVDGDTSTNDTVLLLANGLSGVDPARDGAMWKLFEEAVTEVARTLALAVVQDGEGATKLLEIHVVGAQTEAFAREVGRAIARSTLVKTAVYGADPNWGRVLAAAGAAGVPLTPDRLNLQAATDGDWITLAAGGATAHPDAERARAIFQQKTIRLRLDLGVGRAEAVVWTCDLSPDYVRINSDYTS
ncbi:MAG TPA: bifunctional glutamate N-acetyltransferase/amino-acid acetyltransferase ArgJ [Gemmatimonadales bacterium]|jgi:glutamate N-acetyltransferase/amino-acid N-acetyltransferase|nr:bifunctional glutamate N-acetyltransferase/amino-acid acetyltransferase ArgJ [Gemmatimonadales bacterium]